MVDHFAEYQLHLEELDFEQWVNNIIGNANNTITKDHENSGIVNNGLTNVVFVTDQVNKAVETDEVDKVVSTQEVDEVVSTNEVDEVVITDEVDKAVETNEVDKVVSTDKVDKVVILTEQPVNSVRSVQKKR